MNLTHNDEPFPAWLDTKIEQRGWTRAEFARRAGLSQSQVSRILNAEQNAGQDFCRGAARALGLPPPLVARRAGLIDSYPLPEPANTRERFLEIWDCLPPDRQVQLYDLAQIFLQWSTLEMPQEEQEKLLL